MGYTTEFSGELKFNKKLDQQTIRQIADLNRFNPHEEAHAGRPASFCQWVVSDGRSLKWDGNEKFYLYVEWLEYIIDNILKPGRYTLSGQLYAEGEEQGDLSTIFVKNNKVTHSPLTRSEKKAYRSDQKKQALKDSGTIVYASHGESNLLGRMSFLKLHDFLRGKSVRPNGVYWNLYTLVLEKDGGLSLYYQSDFEKKRKTMSAASLRSHKKYQLYLNLSAAEEIVHFASPLYSRVLGSKNVYCVGFRSLKYLIEVEDPAIFEKTKEYPERMKPGFIFYTSDDSTLRRYLIETAAWGIAALAATGIFLGFLYSSVTGLMGAFSLKRAAYLVLSPVLYYYFLRFQYYGVYHIPLSDVFRTKVAPNHFDK